VKAVNATACSEKATSFAATGIIYTKKSIIVYTYNKEQCQVGTDIKKNVLVPPENGHGYTISVLRSYVITTNSKTDITTVQHYPLFYNFVWQQFIRYGLQIFNFTMQL